MGGALWAIARLCFGGRADRPANMPLHLIKLCVGCDSLAELADWQKQRLKEKRAKGRKPELIHITRMTPKRAEEVLDGGSLYRVFKGVILCRQMILAVDTVGEGAAARCEVTVDPEIIRVAPTPRRAFQGWRYLEAKDAPPDLARIFDKGYTTKTGHTGLGLHRLRQLLRRHPRALTDARLIDDTFIFTVSV